MRAVAAGWVALLLTAALHSILRLPNRRPILVGMALATTPAVFFFGASVNPSGMAIAAGIAVWTGGFALLRSDALPRARLHFALAGACAPLCLLLLVRRDSLLWAGLIVLSLAAITPRQRWKELAASRASWGWAAAVLAAIVLQLATGGHGTAELVGNAVGGSASGAWNELGQDIREIGGGVLGWRDTPMPTFVYVVFIGGTVVLAAFSLLRAPRRLALVLAGLTILVVAAPLAIGAYRYPYFQGRYILPMSVGVALLAGLGLSEEPRWEEWPSALTITILAVVGTAQVLAFAQVLRRFTAGRNGGWFFAHPTAWRPPGLDATPLTILYAAAIVALLAWCLLLVTPEHEPLTSVGSGDVLRATAPRRPRPMRVER
jgi:hypothetical protein